MNQQEIYQQLMDLASGPSGPYIDGRTLASMFGNYVAAAPRINYTASRPPVLTDDETAGYSINSMWMDGYNGQIFLCLSADAGNAYWVPITSYDQITTYNRPYIFGHTFTDRYVAFPTINEAIIYGCPEIICGGLIEGHVNDLSNYITIYGNPLWGATIYSTSGPALISSSGSGFFYNVSWISSEQDTSVIDIDLAWYGNYVFVDNIPQRQNISHSNFGIVTAPGVSVKADEGCSLYFKGINTWLSNEISFLFGEDAPSSPTYGINAIFDHCTFSGAGDDVKTCIVLNGGYLEMRDCTQLAVNPIDAEYTAFAAFRPGAVGYAEGNFRDVETQQIVKRIFVAEGDNVTLRFYNVTNRYADLWDIKQDVGVTGLKIYINGGLFDPAKIPMTTADVISGAFVSRVDNTYQIFNSVIPFVVLPPSNPLQWAVSPPVDVQTAINRLANMVFLAHGMIAP